MGWTWPTSLGAMEAPWPQPARGHGWDPCQDTPQSQWAVGALPSPDLTCSCSWSAVLVTNCSSMALVVSCCSPSSFSSRFISCSVDLVSESKAWADLASMGLLGGCPSPPNWDAPSPLGSLAAPQGGKPSPILLPQLQDGLGTAIHFPVGSSHPQLSKGILQLPDLRTVATAQSGNVTTTLSQHRDPLAAPSLPKPPLASLQPPQGLSLAHLLLLTLQVTGQALQGGDLALEVSQDAGVALLV